MNLTSPSVPQDETTSVAWWTNIVVCAVCLAFCFYLFGTLIAYQIMRSQYSECATQRNGKDRKFGLFARILCILTSFMVTSYVILKLVTLLMESAEKENSKAEEWTQRCNIVGKIRNCAMVLSLFLVYVFLWARQKVFYIHKALVHLNTRSLTIGSNLILVVWVVYVVATTIALMLLVQYEYKEGVGCVTRGKTAQSLRVILIVYLILSIFMQVSLLILFIHPITRQSTIRVQLTQRSPRNQHSFTRLIFRVKKAIVLSLICIISDVVTFSLSLVTFSNTNYAFSSFYVINLTLNAVCLLFCFDNWIVMLIPCKVADERRRRRIQSATQTSSQNSRSFTS